MSNISFATGARIVFTARNHGAAAAGERLRQPLTVRRDYRCLYDQILFLRATENRFRFASVDLRIWEEAHTSRAEQGWIERI